MISFHVNAGNPGLLGGHSPSFKRISFGNELFQPPPSVVLGFYLFRLQFLFFGGGGVEWMEDYAQISGLFLDTRVWRFIVEMGSRLLKNMFFQQNFA